MLSNHEIRLLDILPSSNLDNDDVLVRCQTRIIPVSSNSPFETLSYVWGDKSDCTQINVDGIAVGVTSNLALALKHIRFPESIRTIWVDQLCINQSDEIEKAVQVPLMGHIYSHTTQCLVWFGPIHPDISLFDAKLALDLLRLLHDGKQNDAAQLSTAFNLGAENILPRAMQALDSISPPKNPWWTRTWTLQESILPSKVCVVWGNLTIEWETLDSAASNWVSFPCDPIFYPYIDRLNGLLSQVIGLRWSKENRLGPLDIAFRWAFRSTTRPQDKVYGLMGLFKPGTLPRSQVCDYRLSPAKIYAMFTVDLIEYCRDLHALALKYMHTHPESTEGLPNWAMDMDGGIRWEISIDGDSCPWYVMNTYNFYNASGTTTLDLNRVQYDQVSNTLSLAGFKVDDIAVAVPKPTEDVLGTSNITCTGVARMVQGWYQIAEDFYQSHTWHISQDGPRTWSEAFWTALVGDLRVSEEFFPQGQATSEDIKMAKEFVQTGVRHHICYSLFANIARKKLIITAMGMLGFGPHHSKVGDQVWILHGGNMPFVLRQATGETGSINDFQFVGPSYVDGIMQGEVAHLGKPVCDVVLR
ncbi:heterokaryon incompatibility protein-domain-containing protein [Hypoxylon argillaceum]|nr:heterokaryon incompatibility protein-domain-containing protein [Hypoxylon argillaceum]